MKKSILLILISTVSIIITSTVQAKEPVVAPSYAWKAIPPIGITEPATIDTLLYNYYQQAIPSMVSPAYATTGNLCAEGLNMIYMERQPMSDFFFRDAQQAWLPSSNTPKFYNTRIPMTLLSYNFGGEQDRLQATFSGNANKKIQIGAMLDYLYSKGSYNYQAAKGLIWGFSGSYMGERYELQASYFHYNLLNKENGGITNDLFITDPAEVQGGSTSVDTKTIPTHLSAAHSRVKGANLMVYNRYKVGYYKDITPDSLAEQDTTIYEFVPVSTFNWALNYTDGKHQFRNDAPGENDFWENTYLNNYGTSDYTTYWTLTNTLGISLLEGFNKYAKAGLTAFATHQLRKYNQTIDTITPELAIAEDLSPYPLPNKIAPNVTENLLWIGGQLTKQQGSLLTYNATAKFGVLGPVAGDINVEGDVSTKFKLFGDSVTITGYGIFSNEEAPYLIKNYVSNHFIWENDFGKTRRLRFGGQLNIPHTKTNINVGVENVQNYIYFNDKCLPMQHGGSVQVFSATLKQNFKVGILHWDNRLTYQTSSEKTIISLPELTVYSNLYLLFKVAKVLDVQFGIDCDYYTSYYSPSYQPATMTFYNQQEIKVGNYPFMNLYANMKLKKTRFYVMFTHVNKGLTGNNYFSMPHYPLNPRRFQLGVSIDFAN